MDDETGHFKRRKIILSGERSFEDKIVIRVKATK